MSEKEYIQYLNTTCFFDDEKNVIYHDEIEHLFKMSENLVNNFSFNPIPLAEEIYKDSYLRCLFLHMLFGWIDYFSKLPTIQYERNTCAMNLIKEINDFPEYREIRDFYMSSGMRNEASFEGFAISFAENGYKMHRTLMQTFTGFLFCFLSKNPMFNKVDERLVNKYGEKWWNLPFI